MRIVLIGLGSLGDIQPLACLALELQKRGHIAILASEKRFQQIANDFGIPFAEVAGDLCSYIFDKEVQQVIYGGSVGKLFYMIEKVQASTNEQTILDLIKACEGADVVIGSPLALYQSYSVAEKYNAIWIPLMLGPYFPTGDFPNGFVSHRNFNIKLINLATHTLVENTAFKKKNPTINQWRTQVLNLQPLKTGINTLINTNKIQTIFSLSEKCIPGFKRPSDWGEHISITGFIFPPEGFYSLNPNLERFINEGPAPVYIGFGSMVYSDPKKLLYMVKEVIAAIGIRIVLVGGWTDIKDIEDNSKNLLIVDKAPHDWLFPKCCCIIHHGGAGTTASVLRSGVPSVACPFLGDQPFYGWQLNQLGVSPAPISCLSLSTSKLSDAILEMLNSKKMRMKAKVIAEEINKIDGTKNAVDKIEKIIEETQKQSKL